MEDNTLFNRGICFTCHSTLEKNYNNKINERNEKFSFRRYSGSSSFWDVDRVHH